MAKRQVSFKINCDLDDYLLAQVNKGRFANKSQAFSYMLNYYREQEGFKIQMPQQFTRLAADYYNKLIPFTFGCLSTFLFTGRNWLFIPTLIVAIIPFIFKIQVQNEIIKVST